MINIFTLQIFIFLRHINKHDMLSDLSPKNQVITALKPQSRCETSEPGMNSEYKLNF